MEPKGLHHVQYRQISKIQEKEIDRLRRLLEEERKKTKGVEKRRFKVSQEQMDNLMAGKNG